MKKRAKRRFFWLDTYTDASGDLMWGIESSDKSLTFDGHFVCVFPRKKGEKFLDESFERATAFLNILRRRKKT